MSLSRGRAIVQSLLPLLAWVAVAALMVRDDVNDPFDPQLTGTARYGHNHSGALVDVLVITVMELLVIYAILRPWSLDSSRWRRAMALALVFVPWTMISMLSAMHAGGIVALHVLWVMVVLALALVLWLWLGLTAVVRRRA
jgi:hypothetical protein